MSDSQSNTPPATDSQRQDATQATLDANDAMASALPPDDPASRADADRGLLLRAPSVTIYNDGGDVPIWDLEPYQYQLDPSVVRPDTINPSLWRQAQLNTLNGVYKVVPGFYQVRAYDMSNMTVIEAPDGLIIIDPLISVNCAKAALALYRQARPGHATTPVAAVIYTHSHVDHFGGVRGVITEQDNDIEVYAPDGFLEHAVSENVYAGVAMLRRAQYMYGPYLTQDAKGQVDGGLGKGQSTGEISLIAPTHVITERLFDTTIAGLPVTFQLTPGAEAPAEMNFFFPAFGERTQGILCGAENLTRNMHNLQTLRGAHVRDPLAWSRYLNDAVNLFGDEADVLFNQHHWPIWDKDNVNAFIRRQRDMYRYFNDQSLRMLNRGYTGIEIAEVFEMPPAIQNDWSCRGYYGTVNHNVKAVYDRYMGWFNGNPSDLHPLPPSQSAPRYIDLMGGADAVMTAATAAYDAGEYRWAAELLNHLVFADQNNQTAKELLANVLEQLGYQAEAATWRNFYLMGAQELRGGIVPPEESVSSEDMLRGMTTEMLFDSLAARLIGPQAVAHPVVMFWRFTDEGGALTEQRLVEVSNGSLSQHSVPLGESVTADVTVTVVRATLDNLLLGNTTLEDALASGELSVEDDTDKLIQFFALLDTGDPNFPIVTPRSDAKAAWDGGPVKLQSVAKQRRRFFLKTPRGC